jgi:hypothetical protein
LYGMHLQLGNCKIWFFTNHVVYFKPNQYKQ